MKDISESPYMIRAMLMDLLDKVNVDMKKTNNPYYIMQFKLFRMEFKKIVKKFDELKVGDENE